MQLVCEGHSQIAGMSPGMRLVLNRPTVLDDPVIQGESDVEGFGASIYGSVIEDGGVYRMWYQAWPRDWDGSDAIAVACAESDDGLVWRRPVYGVLESCGSTQNHLTDLPFHCPSVFLDPDGGREKRYRAFGYTDPAKLKGRYSVEIRARGYFTAYSADGIHWQMESPEPTWPHADVITSTWDTDSHCARIALKHNGLCHGMFRRRFFTATWARGQASEPVSAFFPDEVDDANARARGLVSADYYGVGLMPTPGPSIGFLWNFRHQQPLGYSEPQQIRYGSVGHVDLSVVYQLERGGRWLHLPGRPDWLAARTAPRWARGGLYTAASPIHVGDETWLYFTGTQDYHGWCGQGVDTRTWRDGVRETGGFARIGLLKWRRDRVMGYEADHLENLDLTPAAAPPGQDARLVINAATRTHGRVRVGLADAKGQPLPGYGLDDCDPLNGDLQAAPVTWRGSTQLPRIAPDQKVIARLEIQSGTLYAFEFTGAS